MWCRFLHVIAAQLYWALASRSFQGALGLHTAAMVTPLNHVGVYRVSTLEMFNHTVWQRASSLLGAAHLGLCCTLVVFGPVQFALKGCKVLKALRCSVQLTCVSTA